MGKIKAVQWVVDVIMSAGIPEKDEILTSIEFASPVKVKSVRSWFVYYSNASATLKPLAGVGLVGSISLRGDAVNPPPDNILVNSSHVPAGVLSFQFSEYPSVYSLVQKNFNAGSFDWWIDACVSFGPVNPNDVIRVFIDMEY